MTKRFRESTLDQMYLLPPSLQEWLPEGHLARFVAELCEELKLDKFLARHEERDGRGQAAYHPVLLVRLLVYGYCVGKRSSRQIEKATHDDVAFRYLSANHHPDHTTIAEFRRQHLAELSELFAQVLVLCRKAGLVKLGAIAVDGTKILANASPEETARYMQLCQWEQRIEEKIKAMLEEAERVDREEDAAEKRDGIQRDLPQEMATTKQRLEKIRQVKQELEEETREKANKVRAERQASGGKHRNEAAKKRHQRATKPIEKINPQGNLVDPDSKLLKDPVTGGFIQAFNAQLAVDAQTQIIVAAAVTNEVNDREQLKPMAELIEQSIEAKPEVLLADAGYFANEPMEELEKKGWKLTVNPDAARKRSQAPANAAKSEIAGRMRKRIRDEVDGPIYQLRKQTVEPVFGQIKEARGIRRFLLRGFEKVRAEWQLICLTHNALKLYRNAPAVFGRVAKAA